MTTHPEGIQKTYTVTAAHPPTAEYKYNRNLYLGVVAESIKEAIKKVEEKFPLATIHSINSGPVIHIL